MHVAWSAYLPARSQVTRHLGTLAPSLLVATCISLATVIVCSLCVHGHLKLGQKVILTRNMCSCSESVLVETSFVLASFLKLC